MLGRLDSEAARLCLGPRYSVSERRWTQMLAGGEDGGPGPSPRSFHAAAYVPAGRGAMYLLGGLTAGGVTRDFWVLNLTTLQWRQEKVSICPTPAPASGRRQGRPEQLRPAPPPEQVASS